MRRRVAQHRLWSEATGADGSEAEGGAEDKLGSAMFFLILAIVVVLFGLGVVVVNRRRERRLSLERARPPTKPVEKPPPEVLEPEAAAPDLAEPEVDEAEDLDTNSRRSPSSKSSQPPRASATVSARPVPRSRARSRRSARRASITDETWDDLEEALLRADVGVSLTTAAASTSSADR